MCTYITTSSSFTAARLQDSREVSSNIHPSTEQDQHPRGTEFFQLPDNPERMFIRVALPNKEEGIFNADCSVVLLLDTIKKRHQIASEDEIDLCSEGGVLKNLLSQLSAASGVSFFELRELCLVVRAVPSGAEDSSSDDGHSPPVTYVPVLAEYQNDEDLIATLNNSSRDGNHSGDQGKARKKQSNRLGSKPGTPDGGKGKLPPAKVSHKSRRLSISGK